MCDGYYIQLAKKENTKKEGSVINKIAMRTYVANKYAVSVNFQKVNSTSIHTSSPPYLAIQDGADVTANIIHFTQLTESVIRAIYNEIIVADPLPTGFPTTNTNLYDDSVSYTVIDISDIPKTENINLLSANTSSDSTIIAPHNPESTAFNVYGYKIDVNRYVFCHLQTDSYKLIEEVLILNRMIMMLLNL